MPAGREKAEIKFGVRPEDIILGDTGYPATVKIVEPTGHESIVLLELLVRPSSRHASRRISGLPSARAHGSASAPARLHVFDRSSGVRMAGGGP